MAEHGEFTVDVPSEPVSRKKDGTLSSIPKVFIHLYSERTSSVNAHEISFEVAEYINRSKFSAAVRSSRWPDIIVALSEAS